MSIEYHRRRQQNLQDVNAAVGSCMAEHRIGEYIAGQVTYNLGEYPEPTAIAPTEYDRELLQSFADHGVGLIQLHEEWNDSQRVLGGHKFKSHDEAGLRAFIDLVHELGMKIMLYASTGFFEATDADFDPGWSQPDHLVELYFDYAHCSPAHPGWRAYCMPWFERLLDELGVDGLYDDAGYSPLYLHPEPLPGDIRVGPETEQVHSSFWDLLGLVGDMVHARGGVFKVHVGGTEARGLTSDLYDYLWVGESIEDVAQLRGKTKAYDPYVVPCPDMSRARIEREDDLYLHSVPYMQFPLRVDGRPVTGRRAMVEGMTYRNGEDCFWTRHMRGVNRYYTENPEAPPMYGWWDSCPGRADARERWLHHFDLYRPMVAEGSRAWLQIGENTLFAEPLPADVTVSAFVNDETYLVAANYSEVPVTLKSTWQWEDRESRWTGSALELAPGTLRYLRRA